MARKKKGKCKVTSPSQTESDSPASLELIAQCPDLCKDCQRIYIKGMRGLEFAWSNGEYGVYVSDLFHVREASSCRLCRFFFVMGPQPSSPSDLHLQAISARGLYTEAVNSAGKPFTEQDAIFFAVVTTKEKIRTEEVLRNPLSNGLIAERQPWNGKPGLPPHYCTCRSLDGWETRRCSCSYQGLVRSDRIDYRLLQNWLSGCKRVCGSAATLRDLSVRVNLINVITREVETPMGRAVKFIALSYVWGGTPQGRLIVEGRLVKKLPEPCPATVEDAITVTRQLGYQYLWVDIFCIDQDPTTRHNQIARMDIIYRCADVTIIAAAGKDAEYGIPGVSHVRKVRQPCVAVGKSIFVSTLRHPPEVVKRSIWFTRGWTYQERFFSRRCLVFTDDQVHLECANHQYVYESLSQPHTSRNESWSMRHVRDESLKLIPAKIEPQIIYRIDGSEYSDHHDSQRKPMLLRMLEYHIKQYTSRDLTYEEDSLNALKGVLNRFPNQPYPIEHLWGVPLQPKPHLIYPFFADPPTTQALIFSSFDFAYGLCWTHGAKNFTSWRRGSFPSWSWAGWVGTVSWLIPTTAHGTFTKVGYEKTSFTYMAPDGKAKPVRKWQIKQNLAPPRFLNVKAAVFHFRFQNYKPHSQEASHRSHDKLREMEAHCAGYKLSLTRVRKYLTEEDFGIYPKPVDEELRNIEPGTFYLKSYKETVAPFGRSRHWAPAEPTRLHLSRTSAEGQDWEQRLLTESWPAIILGQDTNVTYWLVLGRIRPEDNFYERIGVIQFPPDLYSLEFLEQGEEFRLG